MNLFYPKFPSNTIDLLQQVLILETFVLSAIRTSRNFIYNFESYELVWDKFFLVYVM